MTALPLPLLSPAPAAEPVTPQVSGRGSADVVPMRQDRVMAARRGVRDTVIVANRLPVRINPQLSTWEVSPGGLVSAMSTVLGRGDTAWVGWPGERSVRLEPFELKGTLLHPVPLSPPELEGFYEGFSNSTLWPLFHDLPSRPQYHRSWFDHYHAVNERFARGAAAAAAPGATVWVHDYQLMLVPRMLRTLRPDVRIGYFQHIPFPPPELFLQLPWRDEIVDGLLGADLVGFQTPGDAANFSRVAPLLGKSTAAPGGLLHDGRSVSVDAFPIAVDTARIQQQAAERTTTERMEAIRADLGNPGRVLLGVDRLDYTKGITVRLRAFLELLEDGVIQGPEDAVFVQVAVPSRERAGGYAEERRRIAQLVTEINGRFGGIGHPAVHYLARNVPFDELLGLYRAADVMVVTPLKDGMNLVAKEFVAARVHHRGVLVLSEFAGAAHELRDALLVNPYDLAEVKSAITTGLRMDPREQQRRMRALQAVVTEHDVHVWCASFLRRLEQT